MSKQTMTELMVFDDDTRKVLKYLAFVGFLPTMIWAGFVLKTLWLWFMVPLGIPVIGLVHALGLNLMLKAFLPLNVIKDAMDDDKYRIPAVVRQLCAWVFGAMVLGTGFIFTLFM